MWSKGLIFLGGVVLGAGATFLFMKKKLDFVREDCEAQIEDMKANYKKKTEETSQFQKDLARENAQRKEDLLKSDEISRIYKRTSDEMGEVKPKSYNAFANPMSKDVLKDFGEDSEDEEDDEFDEEDGIREYPQENDIADRPYIISEFDYIHGRKMYDKTTLNFYDDGILEEEASEDLIDDIDAAIGRDSLTKFGEEVDDMVFVRNERISTDFAVVRQHRDYLSSVRTGFPEDST